MDSFPLLYVIFVSGNPFMALCYARHRQQREPSELFSKVGTESFYDLVVNDGAFIDKSLLIDKYLQTKEKLLLLTRPERFGKTINADMIRRFIGMQPERLGSYQSAARENEEDNFDDNYKLFAGGTIRTKSGELKTLQPLKISYNDFSLKHQGQWPVLYVSFGRITGNTSKQIEKSFAECIGQLFSWYAYLGSSCSNAKDRDTYDTLVSGSNNASFELMENSLDILVSGLSKRRNRKVHLIIDDYDAPLLTLLSALMDVNNDGNYNLQLWRESAISTDCRNLVDFLRSLLTNVLNNNNYHLKKALVIGVLPVNDILDGLGLGNVGKMFGDFYGFSQMEVDALVAMTDLEERSGGAYSNSGKVYEALRAYYGGYSNMGELVSFNAFSVPNYLQRFNNNLYCFTHRTIIRQLLSTDEVQLELSRVLNGTTVSLTSYNEPINLDNIRRRNSVLHMLLFFGYLTPVKSYNGTADDTKGRLQVPNTEMKSVIRNYLVKWASRAFCVSEDRIQEMAQMIMDEKMEEFELAIKQLLANKPPGKGPLV